MSQRTKSAQSQRSTVAPSHLVCTPAKHLVFTPCLHTLVFTPPCSQALVTSQRRESGRRLEGKVWPRLHISSPHLVFTPKCPLLHVHTSVFTGASNEPEDEVGAKKERKQKKKVRPRLHTSYSHQGSITPASHSNIHTSMFTGASNEPENEVGTKTEKYGRTFTPRLHTC